MSSGRGGHREGAGRRSGWKNQETQTIRVPKVLAAQLLEIAKKLDSGEVIDFVSQSKVTVKPKKDSVTKSISRLNDNDTESNMTLAPLSGSALARRLGFSEKTVRHHRDGVSQPPLSEWSQSLDPTGVAWVYQPETKKYYPS